MESKCKKLVSTEEGKVQINDNFYSYILKVICFSTK